MRWLLFGLLFGAAACGFNGSGDEPTPDGGTPGPKEDEVDISLDSAEKLAADATFSETFLSGNGAAAGTVEPVARAPGKLLIEIDDDGGAFDGTWASKPARSTMLRHSLMTPVFSQTPRGAPANFNAWFAGEMRLDAGAQKVGVTSASNAIAFVELLGPDGAPLVHCTTAECDVTAPAAGWYTVHAGWRRPVDAVDTTFLLRWSVSGTPSSVPLDRLRTALHTAELAGSRVDGFSQARGFGSLENATVIDVENPIDLVWGGSLLGLSQNATYRSSTQLRVTEAGMYDFALDGDEGASYRLWVDGEWVNDPTMFDYRSDMTNPAPETVTRMLSAGWHDVMLEGYDTRGDNGEVKVFFGKQGQATNAPSLTLTRPAIGIAPQMSVATNLDAIQMIAGTAVSREVTVAGLAASNPTALGIDVSVTLRPRVWPGLQIHLVPPGSNERIPLVFEISTLPDNQPGVVSGSLRKDRFGANDKAHGTWRIEVTHPNAGGAIDATNRVTEVELHVHYAAAAGSTSATTLVPTTSTYSKMVQLPSATELRGLFAPEAILPAGTGLTLSAQVCSDLTGTSCDNTLSAEQVASMKPTARFVKVTATFTSDGFAVPILNKLIVRHQK